jgi:hypothetical protein
MLATAIKKTDEQFLLTDAVIELAAFLGAASQQNRLLL